MKCLSNTIWVHIGYVSDNLRHHTIRETFNFCNCSDYDIHIWCWHIIIINSVFDQIELFICFVCIQYVVWILPIVRETVDGYVFEWQQSEFRNSFVLWGSYVLCVEYFQIDGTAAINSHRSSCTYIVQVHISENQWYWLYVGHFACEHRLFADKFFIRHSITFALKVPMYTFMDRTPDHCMYWDD